MSKIRRHFEDGYPYLITTVTHKRESIFTVERNCKILMVTLEFFKLTLDYRIFAYCLMPDHLHIILQPTGKYDLSYIMRMIKGNFARKFNLMYDRRGKVWQEGFYDTGIRSIGMLLQKIEYIHNNPVRAGIVSHPDQYTCSSYPYYFGTHYSGIPGIDQFT